MLPKILLITGYYTFRALDSVAETLPGQSSASLAVVSKY
jgi:hypothetical protein